MTEQNKAVEQDPLAMPASEQNTDYPLLKGGKSYRFIVRSVELVDAKSEEAPAGAQNLKIAVSTTKDELSVDDQPIYKGHTISKYIPLYESGRFTRNDMQRAVATFIKAVEGPASKTPLSAPRDNPEKFIDKMVECRVGIQHDKSGNYPDSNTIQFNIPKA